MVYKISMLVMASKATTSSQLPAALPWRIHSLLGYHWQFPIHKTAERTSETQKGPAPAPSPLLISRFQQISLLCSSHTMPIPATKPLFLWFPFPGWLFLKHHLPGQVLITPSRECGFHLGHPLLFPLKDKPVSNYLVYLSPWLDLKHHASC